ncbi:MAG TPA: xanthine dehydrogenase family protein molybdopterin-binding subunit [Candidatus Limnocylindria bacterium]|nr:xanthine dehydrogenase family protein molybdopterin-binding subunit [Candidatus Limnocylindria bacterium]
MSRDAFGAPEARVEGRSKVTGAARYAADITMPGMLWAAFVGCPYPHARVIAVDASDALALPGVHAVISGADTKPARLGRRLLDWPVLAWDGARFVGDPVAAVAATSRALAQEAARRVRVDYEELPALLDPAEALAANAPPLHPARSTYPFLGPPVAAVPHPNVQGHEIHAHGDVAGAMASAAHVFEHQFTFGRNFQAYLEPPASIVWIDGDVVHVITTNKAPFALRAQLALGIGIPEGSIVVDAGYIGGDFGGKGLSVDEFALYFLARTTGRPVKTVRRYADDMQTAAGRHEGSIRLKTAVTAGGKIVAHEARVLLNGGAYAAGKPVPNLLPGDSMLTLAGYHVPSARVEVSAVYTNTVPAGHVRAPGQPQNAFAVESHVDLIARALAIDPLEFRMRNAIQPGDTDVLGERWENPLATEVLTRLGTLSGWGRPLPHGHGRGIGYCVRHVGRGKTSITLEVEADGRVAVQTGVPDQGGGAYTMIQRVVAAEVGIPLDRVVVRHGTTGEALMDPGVGGSRVTPIVGGAAQNGARALVARMAEIAAGTPMATALLLPESAGVKVVGRYDKDYGHGSERYSVYGYVIEVAVDAETGVVRVVDALIVADTGTVINPVAHRGQIEGGFAFGLGQTLMEELRVDDGRVATTNLGDYKIPTVSDVPSLRIDLLTSDTGPGPFGAKSVGELANAAVGPAIANAIDAAVGARVFRLPISAEAVLSAIAAGARSD